MEYQDEELIDLVRENSEEARDELYDKYKYIVDIVLRKYKKSAYYLSIDMEELTQEALLGFSDALVSFVNTKDTSLSTFITICVERRVGNYVRKHNTPKMKLLKEVVSLDMEIEDNLTLSDAVLVDETSPEILVEEKEEVKALYKKIVDVLSPGEFEIYKLLLNNFSYDDISEILNISVKSVYDAVYRMRKKISKIIK